MIEIVSLILQYLVPFLIILSVVVFVHEFGHYWVARRNGVRVEVFSIGFGPELFGWTDSHGTRWKLSVVPLGGYVRMRGEEEGPAAAGGELPPDSFPAKSVWQRMAIVAAGPAANVLLAIVIFAGFFAFVGKPYAPAVVGDVLPESPAAEAGLLPGDRILAVDGEPVTSFEDLQRIVRESPGVPLVFTVERDGQVLELTVVPELGEVETPLGRVRIGLIGVTSRGLEYRRFGPATALMEAVVETGRMMAATLQAIGQMIAGTRGTEELGGPLRIAQMSGEVARQGVLPAVWFAAVLSLNLGLINLFPIPMLDGGHLLLYVIEAVRGRPLSERAQEIAFRIGLAVVFTLMVFAFFNDLRQLGLFELLTG